MVGDDEVNWQSWQFIAAICDQQSDHLALCV
jgi:hypothetical protein